MSINDNAGTELEHEEEPTSFKLFVPTWPTQIEHPWRASLRTAIQHTAGFILGGAALLTGAAVFFPQALKAVVDVLPEGWVAPLAGVVATIVTVSGAVTRLMLIPGVNEFLTKWSLGASPK